jgi:hypothetical protein
VTRRRKSLDEPSVYKCNRLLMIIFNVYRNISTGRETPTFEPGQRFRDESFFERHYDLVSKESTTRFDNLRYLVVDKTKRSVWFLT